MWFYNFGLILYVWAIRLVAPRHPKARLWIERSLQCQPGRQCGQYPQS